MAAVSAPIETCYPRTHPVPRGAMADDSKPLLKRAALISVVFHFTLALGCLAITYWPQRAAIGIPQEEILDVTIIPLSALDTMLPKGGKEEITLTEAENTKDIEKKERPEVHNNSDKPKTIVQSSTLTPSKVLNTRNQDSETSASSQPQSTSTTKIGTANGLDISLEQARISYQDMVATMIARAKRYPERALKRRMTGEGTIRLEIASDGTLADFTIVRSTEASILDEELKAMVERAAPFPAFPSDLRKSRLALIVPIAFRLES